MSIFSINAKAYPIGKEVPFSNGEPTLALAYPNKPRGFQVNASTNCRESVSIKVSRFMSAFTSVKERRPNANIKAEINISCTPPAGYFKLVPLVMQFGKKVEYEENERIFNFKFDETTFSTAYLSFLLYFAKFGRPIAQRLTNHEEDAENLFKTNPMKFLSLTIVQGVPITWTRSTVAFFSSYPIWYSLKKGKFDWNSLSNSGSGISSILEEKLKRDELPVEFLAEMGRDLEIDTFDIKLNYKNFPNLRSYISYLTKLEEEGRRAEAEEIIWR